LLLDELLRHCETDGHFGGDSAGTTTTRLSQALRHLVFHIIVQVSNGRHARALVDGLFYFRRQRHVFDNETGQFETVLRGHDGIDQWQERFPKFQIAARHVEHRNVCLGQGFAEHTHNPRTHHIREFFKTKMLIRPGHFLEKEPRLDDFEIVNAESTRADHAKIVIAHHDRVRGAPLIAGENTRDDEVNVRLERRLEAVLPRFERGQNWNVVGGQRVFAGPECVAELAEVHKLRDLRLAHDQLRAALDFLVLIRETIRERVARIVSPLDDFD